MQLQLRSVPQESRFDQTKASKVQSLLYYAHLMLYVRLAVSQRHAVVQSVLNTMGIPELSKYLELMY